MSKSEIKLCAIPLKVGFGNMMVRPDQSTLEQAEERFHGVRVRHVAFRKPAFLRVLLANVVHRFMAQEVAANVAAVLTRAIRHQVRICRDLLLKNRLERLSGHGGDMERTSGTVTLNQREDFVLVVVPTNAPPRTLGHRLRGSPESLVSLHDLSSSTNRASVRRGEGFADAVRHEPSRFVGHAEHPVELVARHSLFGGAEKMRSENPLMERNLGTLKHGSHGHRVLLAAMPAEQDASPVRLALKAALAIRATAMRAYRAIRPAEGFQMLSGGLFVVKALGSEVHG